MNPLVSVILPCYNAIEFLEEAIQSVRNQTYLNLEIICIDDGSTDATLRRLQKHASEDKRIRLIKNAKNIGLIESLNKGIDLACGEYIARMDSDDVSISIRIEKQVKFIQSNVCDVVGTNVIIIGVSSKNQKNNFLKNTTSKESELASFFLTPLIHPTILAKANVMKENPYLKDDKAVHTEDYELWSRLVRKGYKLFNIDEKLLFYRIRPGGITRKFESIQKENFSRCALDHFNIFFNTNVSIKQYKVVVNRFDSINVPELRLAFKIINKILRHYLVRRNNNEKKNLKMITYYQKLDILTQAIFQGNIIVKTFSTLNILTIFNKNILEKKFWKYFLDKFKKTPT